MSTQSLFTVSGAAAQLGCNRSTITRHCQAHAIGGRLGNLVTLTAADIERLRELVQTAPGNPQMAGGKASELGRKGSEKRWKKPKKTSRKKSRK